MAGTSPPLRKEKGMGSDYSRQVKPAHEVVNQNARDSDVRGGSQ